MKYNSILFTLLIIFNPIHSSQNEFGLQTHYTLSTGSNPPTAIKCVSRVIYRPNGYHYVDSDDMHQDTGMIILTEPSASSLHGYQLLTKKIHELCKDSRNLPEATSLLPQMSQKEETTEEKRYRCAALMRLGEAYLGLPYPNNLTLASSSFHQAAHCYQFSGAAFDLCLVITLLQSSGAIIYPLGMTGDYWLKQAQQYGMQGIEHLETEVKKMCTTRQDYQKKVAFQTFMISTHH